MTPDEFERWQAQQPEWVSQETRVLAACLKDVGDYIDYDIGAPLRSEKNGDALWYVLTNDEGILIILCTPYAIFTENNLDSDDVQFSVLTHPLSYLENLRDSGVRRLTPDELDEFLRGQL